MKMENIKQNFVCYVNNVHPDLPIGTTEEL